MRQCEEVRLDVVQGDLGIRRPSSAFSIDRRWIGDIVVRSDRS